MRSYTDGKSQYGIWSKNTSTANLADGVSEANTRYRHICAMKDWPFLERNRSVSTTAATQFTSLPYDCDLVREISVTPTGQTIRYTPKLAPTRTFWDQLNLVTFTSDIPEWYFVFAGQVGLWPSPVSTGNAIAVIQKTRVIDLAIADITSSTVATATNGSTTVTMSGGMVNLMAGMYIRITYNPGTTNTGDGQWYEIASVTNSTTLVLVRAYGGTTITAGTAACTISQMPLLPESFHDIPWRGAAATYWKKEADERGDKFEADYENAVASLVTSYSSATTDMVIDSGEDMDLINPNLTIRL